MKIGQSKFVMKIICPCCKKSIVVKAISPLSLGETVDVTKECIIEVVPYEKFKW